jgi:WD40 repeat protein
VAKVWEEGDPGGEIRAFEGHAGRIESIAFSPGGRYLLTASLDRSAKLWDLNRGEESRTFSAHRATVRRAVFTPNGTRVFTLGDDNAIWIWDVQTGRELLKLDTLGHMGWDLAVSSDGETISVVSLDKTVLAWEASSTES